MTAYIHSIRRTDNHTSTNYDHMTFLFATFTTTMGTATLGYLALKRVEDTPKGTYTHVHS